MAQSSGQHIMANSTPVALASDQTQLPTALGSNSALKVEGQVVSTTLTVNTTGGAGSATGSATSGALYGELVDVYLNFHASAPNTTDTTLAYAVPALGNIVVVTSSSTDALYRPGQAVCDAAAAPVAGYYGRFVLNGTLTLSLAQCDALTAAVVATIRYLTP